MSLAIGVRAGPYAADRASTGSHVMRGGVASVFKSEQTSVIVSVMLEWAGAGSMRRASRGPLFRFEQIAVAAKHMITTIKAAEVELHSGDRADQSIDHATA